MIAQPLAALDRIRYLLLIWPDKPAPNTLVDKIDADLPTTKNRVKP